MKHGKTKRWVWHHTTLAQQRVLFIAGGVLTGLLAYLFAVLADRAQGLFQSAVADHGWLALVLPPAGFTLSALLARRIFRNTQGSGIPQCIAAMQAEDSKFTGRLLSLRIAGGKILLTLLGLLCGASIGREGPTVQVGASVMLVLGRAFHRGDSALILAGSAAGIAAAFNAPLAGVVFAIEELSRSFEAKTSGLILVTTIVAGLTATTFAGNYSYFGYAQGAMGTPADWFALVLTGLAGGLLGGVFSRLLVEFSRRPSWQDRLGRTRTPVLFACACGMLVALCGLLSGNAVFGTGYREAFLLVHGDTSASLYYVPLKMIATVVSTASGIPGGLFAPSLSIGAGLGSIIAQILPVTSVGQFALLGMTAYLTGVVQSPITSVVIMAEMTDNHNMVVPLMACALIANWVSKRLSQQSLYHALAQSFMPQAGKAESASAAAA